MKKILFLTNHDIGIYNFRLELIEQLLQKGYEVIISSPYGEKIDRFQKMGIKYIKTEVDRHGMNPIKDIKLFLFYKKMLKKENPDVVLTYTIKPNIYGGLAATIQKIPYIVNITGLGSAMEKKGFLQGIILILYKLALYRAKCVFFQNEANRKFFQKKKIGIKRQQLLPGSGVNLEYFSLLPYPPLDSIQFVFIARVMKEKGIDEYLKAAKEIKKEYPKTIFHICGFCEENYEGILKEYENRGIIQYHGMVDDIREILKEVHCIVLPSYHEGMSNVLLEAASSGRPVITTNCSGCKEAVLNKKSGYLVKRQNSQDLIDKIEQFIEFPEKESMGLKGRKWMERNFDRQIVVEAYLKEIER